MKKRILSSAMALGMVFSMLPASVLADSAAVCKIGTTDYTSIAAALEAAGTTESTIVLSGDVTEKVEIAKDKKITIDLNGFTLTSEGDTIANSGKLTIQGEKGKVTTKGAGSAAVLNLIGGDATIVNGTIEGFEWYTIKNHGVMTIKDGTVTTPGTKTASLIANGWDSETEKGEKGEADKAKLTIEKGTFEAKGNSYNAVKNDDFGTLEIKDGKFSVEKADGAVIMNWNEAKIAGGEFTNKAANAYVLSNASADATKAKGNLEVTGGTFTGANILGTGNGAKAGGKFTISGGTFDGIFNEQAKYPVEITDGTFKKDSTVTSAGVISGGTFAKEPDANTLKKGYISKKLDDGTFKVVAGLADYSKVEAAKNKMPKDLTIYTDESVNALISAVEAVKEGLDGSHQDEVDAMAKAIEDAIANLVLSSSVKKFVAKDGNTYKVVSAAKKTVSLAKAKKNVKTLKVPAKVSKNGITYKVVSIGNNAAKGAKKLTKVSIGKNVTSIGSKAFYGCKKLTKVSGGANVKKIGDKAFMNCVKLKSITIGKKVTSIGKAAFYNDKALANVTVKASKLKKVGAKAFKKTSAKVVFSLPKAKAGSYEKLIKKTAPAKATYKAV